MVPEALTSAFGPGGAIAFYAVLVGGLIRLLKTDKLNEILGRLGKPPIPKTWLPWLALALGAVSMTLDAKLGGATWRQAALGAFHGLLAGGFAIAGDSTVVATGKRMMSPDAAPASTKNTVDTLPPAKAEAAEESSDDAPTPTGEKTKPE